MSREVALARLVDEIGGGQVGGAIHAHVERNVGRVREAAVGMVELHRRDAEVEQDRVRLDAVRRQLLEHERELAAQQARLEAAVAPLEALEVRPDRRVAVDRDVAAATVQVGGEQLRVAAGSERAVDDGLARAHREQAAHFLGEDGLVINRSSLQDARQHHQHSLRLLLARGPTPRDPRSRGGPAFP